MVLAIRADFYGHCAAHPDLVPLLDHHTVTLGPMNAEQLRQAITGPARHADCSVEGALLAHLVAEAINQFCVEHQAHLPHAPKPAQCG